MSVKEPESPEKFRTSLSQVLLTEHTCPLLRNTKDNFKAFERIFGTLTQGQAFGEMSFLPENKKKFYNAVALSNCVIISLSKLDFDTIQKEVESKLLNEKSSFVRTIPEFVNAISLSRSKMYNICKAM